MKKILVLLGENNVSGEYLVDKLNDLHENIYEARLYKDAVVTIIDGTVRCFFVTDNSDVADYDLVYLRGIAAAPLRHAIADYLDSKKVPMVNSESHNFQTMTKLEQGVRLALSGVPTPDMVYTGDTKNLPKTIENLGWKFPLIVKAIDGKNGELNEKVDTFEKLSELDFGDAIAQPFLPNDFDYRVIVAGDEILLTYKRIRAEGSDDHRNNITRGGRAENVEWLPNDLQDMARRAAKAVGREFTGLDILTNKDTGQSVVLEVNFNFGKPMYLDAEQEKQYHAKIAKYFSSLI